MYCPSGFVAVTAIPNRPDWYIGHGANARTFGMQRQIVKKKLNYKCLRYMKVYTNSEHLSKFFLFRGHRRSVFLSREYIRITIF